MRFKEYLNENKTNKHWLAKWGYNYENYAIIESNGMISFPDNLRVLEINEEMMTDEHEIPFPLLTVPRIKIVDQRFASFKNFPRDLTCPKDYNTDFGINFESWGGHSGSFTHIQSLQGITPIVHGAVQLRYCTNLNYSKVHTFLKEVRSAITIHSDYIGPILGFLNIKLLKNVWQYGPETEPIEKALEILEKHLKRDRDILDCQEELVHAGLKEYAKL